MPDVLLVTPIVPAATGNGIAMRAGLFLEALARAFRVRCLVIPVFAGAGPADGLAARLATDVTVLSLDRSPDALADLRARLAEPAPRARAAALHPRPRLCRSATLAAAAAVADAARGVALVHVYRLYLAPFLDILLDRPSRPVLTVDVDDLEEQIWRDQGDIPEAQAYARLADHYLPAVDHVITASPADAASLAGRYGRARVTAIPNAVRLPAPTPDPSPAAGAYDLTFVGTLSYQPNADGARWLCQKVLPLLPGVTVALVGSNPPRHVLSLARDERVTVAASVPDVTPWYARTRIAVVPLLAGGGTRIKVPEALAHNRPVVATPVGAAGLTLTPGVDGLVVADGVGGFAEACRRLLQEPQLAARLGAAGREAVAATATVDVVGARAADLFASLVATRRRAVDLAAQLRRHRLAADVWARLDASGIRAVLLKGASFGAWLYASPLDRPSADVDLLIDPACEPAAVEVLAELGFTSLYGRSKAMLAGRPAVVWRRGADYVDVHRGRFWGIGVPAERAWEILSARTESLQVAGRNVTVLDPAARTVQVALHAVASGPEVHQPREDLRRAIAGVSVDVWRDAAELATAVGSSGVFAAALDLTSEGRALARCIPIGTGAQRTREGLLFVDGAPPLTDGLTRLRALPGWWPKTAAVARAVVPTPSYLATRLPWAGRSPLHTALAYPAWLGVLVRHSGPALAAVRRASEAAAGRR